MASYASTACYTYFSKFVSISIFEFEEKIYFRVLLLQKTREKVGKQYTV
jgi:hypothetical protein